MLVGIGVGGRGLFLRGRGFLCLIRVLKKQLKTAKVAAFGEQLLRKHRAVLGGAGADKGGHAHILQLLTQRLYAGVLIAAFRQGDSLRGRTRALPYLGHIAQIVIKKGHSSPSLSKLELYHTALANARNIGYDRGKP